MTRVFNVRHELTRFQKCCKSLHFSMIPLTTFKSNGMPSNKVFGQKRMDGVAPTKLAELGGAPNFV